MLSYPLFETVRDNLVLNLPKLVEGEVVQSEITDTSGTEPSFWEERIKEIVAVLHIEPKARIWTDDGLTVTQEFECTIEAVRWFFSWKTTQGEDLRIPSRKDWKWESDDERFMSSHWTSRAKFLMTAASCLRG
jgi:hypothetical protein